MSPFLFDKNNKKIFLNYLILSLYQKKLFDLIFFIIDFILKYNVIYFK
jgi:hypothetical protein